MIGKWTKGFSFATILFLREVFMSDFTVTDQAVEKLKEYLEQNNISSALRIALMQGGWAGPSLGLALDEPKDNDNVYDQDELKFLVEEGLMNTCGAIRVEFIDAGPRSGFGITSTNSIGGGGGCSSGSWSSKILPERKSRWPRYVFDENPYGRCKIYFCSGWIQ